jgi:diacylglycerol kinase (ATP)
MGQFWMTDWKRVIKALHYSIKGFKAAWVHEAAFRQEVLMLILLVPSGLIMADSLMLKLFLLFNAALIIIVELLNSAIEAVVDRIGTERHPLSGQAKDLGSAAQLVSLAVFCFLWLFICLKYLFIL